MKTILYYVIVYLICVSPVLEAQTLSFEKNPLRPVDTFQIHATPINEQCVVQMIALNLLKSVTTNMLGSKLKMDTFIRAGGAGIALETAIE